MSQTLLDLVQNYFAGDTARQTSAALGESESGVATALRSVVPLALGGVLARAQQPGGAAEVLGLARQAHSSGLLGNLSGLLGGLGGGSTTAPAADGSLLNRGAELLRGVLGHHYAPAVESVSQSAGVRASSVGSLLGMAVPVVLGLLGRHAADRNLDEQSLAAYLSEQRNSLGAALGNLPGALGGALAGLGLGVAGAANVPRGAAYGAANAVERSTPSRWPWLLLALLGLAAALWLLPRGCNRDPRPHETASTETIIDSTATGNDTTTVTTVVTPSGRYDSISGNYIYEVGAPTTLRLPDGNTLTVGASSTESRLYQFLSDPNMAVNDADKTQGWISFDRLYFATGKATLTDESMAQLRNVAVILKAFPSAEVKLGGYTDNTGQPDANMVLSADRANAAMKALTGMGITAARVRAEGYGQEHPIATNDTPEGRAQNRRIDVRVTKK